MPNPFSWELYLRQKDAMQEVLYPSHQPPFERSLEHELYDLSFEHMMLRHAHYQGDREMVDVWQLHRAQDGAWSMRLWRSLARELGVEVEDRSAQEEAELEVEGLAEELREEGQPEARIEAYLALRRELVLAWSPLPPELAAFAERELGRCLAFFRRFPGFQPGLTPAAIRAPDFDSGRVFEPPRHADDPEVARSRAWLEQARERRAELEAELEPEPDEAPDDREEPGPELH
jgi:hypothetical protein